MCPSENYLSTWAYGWGCFSGYVIDVIIYGDCHTSKWFRPFLSAFKRFHPPICTSLHIMVATHLEKTSQNWFVFPPPFLPPNWRGCNNYATGTHSAHQSFQIQLRTNVWSTALHVALSSVAAAPCCAASTDDVRRGGTVVSPQQSLRASCGTHNTAAPHPFVHCTRRVVYSTVQ